MSKERFTLRAAVYLMLIKDNKILLARRFNTGWQDGKYSLIAGHLDGHETVKDAMIREAKEEGGVDLKSEALQIVHTMHRESNDNLEYIDFFLIANKWEGEPKVAEPDKCDEIRWFPLDNLPETLLPYVKKAIECYHENIHFSEFNWE